MSEAEAKRTPTETSLSLLRAADGDCLFLRCRREGRSFNILIDAGRSSTIPVLKSFLEKLPDDERRIDLFVVTHVDADHIEGALVAARDPMLRNAIRAVMFNGVHHLREPSGVVELSTAQGDAFAECIIANGWEWNAATGGRAVRNDAGENPIALCEAPKVRAWILGPSTSALSDLARRWPLPKVEAESGFRIVEMGSAEPDVSALAASEYKRDRAPQNGSSIALLVEHAGARILVSADSHAETLVESIGRLFGEKLAVDVATVPHHGSKHNTSPELAASLHAAAWTISTEGSPKHAFPNGESIARILTRREGDVRLIFNSSHGESAIWDRPRLKNEYGYQTFYLADGEGWITAVA